MKLNLKVEYIQQWADVVNDEDLQGVLQEKMFYGRRNDGMELDTSISTPENLKVLQKILKENHEDKSNSGALQNLSLYFKVLKNPPGMYPGKLETLKEGLTQYIMNNSKRKWLYQEQDGQFLAYAVQSIKYTKADYRSETPASVSIKMKYHKAGKSREQYIYFYHENLKVNGEKRTIKELLDSKNMIVGSEVFDERYDEELKDYKEKSDKVGEQFISDGWGDLVKEDNHWSRNNSVKMSTDGVFHKLVVDTPENYKIKVSDMMTSSSYWGDEDGALNIPIHPFINLFNLKDHKGYHVHSSSLFPYEYDKDIINKLVLPQEVMELIDILSSGTHKVFKDIVDGKAAGVIIGCMGRPGIGKTLTAEVYSEYLERPLYTVQCSQLGVDPEKLEEKLGEVLSRAARWNAVLLLDEADVYIRKRMKDVHQNAIVGVFLRVLEYYKGVMFMTTNLADDIDDAIESRFTARIEFMQHTPEELTRIWEILSKQLSVPVSPQDIAKMVEEYPHIAGRSVRSVLKLCGMLSAYKKVEVNYGVLKHAAKFAIMEKSQRITTKAMIKDNGVTTK